MATRLLNYTIYLNTYDLPMEPTHAMHEYIYHTIYNDMPFVKTHSVMGAMHACNELIACAVCVRHLVSHHHQ